MAVTLEELEAQALKLPIKERSELVHRLLVSLDAEPEGTPEEIAKAWEEEIARRVADMDAGRTQLIPADDVYAEIDRIIAAHENSHENTIRAGSACGVCRQHPSVCQGSGCNTSQGIQIGSSPYKHAHQGTPGHRVADTERLPVHGPGSVSLQHRISPPPGVLGGAAIGVGSSLFQQM